MAISLWWLASFRFIRSFTSLQECFTMLLCKGSSFFAGRSRILFTLHKVKWQTTAELHQISGTFLQAQLQATRPATQADPASKPSLQLESLAKQWGLQPGCEVVASRHLVWRDTAVDGLSKVRFLLWTLKAKRGKLTKLESTITQYHESFYRNQQHHMVLLWYSCFSFHVIQGTFGNLQPCSTSNGTWTTTRSVPRPGRKAANDPRGTSTEVMRMMPGVMLKMKPLPPGVTAAHMVLLKPRVEAIIKQLCLGKQHQMSKEVISQKVVTCFCFFGCTIMISIMASEKTWGFIIKCLQPWRISPNLWSLRVLASWMKISADGLFGCVVKNELTKSPDGESH